MVISGIAYAQDCGAPTTNGMAAYYPLDGNGNDGSGNGNNGSVVGPNITWETDAMINSSAFVGNNSAIQVTQNADINSLDQITISAWVKGASGGGGYVVYKNGDFNINSNTTNQWLMFSASRWDGSSVKWRTPNNFLPGGGSQWNHIVVAYDYSSTANNAAWYLNGQLVSGVSEITGPPAGTAQPSTNDLFIGNNSGTSNDWNNNIDDLRIYNRVLSVEEIAQLYTYGLADEGSMIFNQSQAAIEYCNGTDWVMAGTGSYNPNAVIFDGSSDYLESTSALTGVNNTKRATISLWLRYTGTTATTREYFYTDSITRGIRGTFFTSGATSIYAYDSLGNAIAQYDFGTALYDQQWHHVLMSYDLTDTNKRHVYLDGSEVTGGWNVYVDELIDLAGHGMKVGARYNNQRFFEGGIADMYIDFGTYIDLSIAENRRKFISTSGMPMYLGADGSIPTGAAPDIFLSGDTANWHINKGTGGGFTENGEITYSSSRPADPINLDPNYTAVSSGLVGWWKLDETAGTTATDSSGNGNDLDTMVDVTAATLTTAGIIDRGFSFSRDGFDENKVYGNGIFPVVADQPFTVTAWVYDRGGVNGTIWTIGDNDIRVFRDGTALFISTSAGSSLEGHSDYFNQWTFLVATYDGTDVKLYRRTHDVNGGIFEEVNDTVQYGVSTGTTANGDFKIGGTNAAFGESMDMIIDNVRFYDRALSVGEFSAIYNYCVNNNKGAMQYNSDYNVMQYCNGVEWVAMGPVGGTPPTNGLVGHWELDETSGTTATDSVGTNDGTMQAGLDASNDSTAGLVSTALRFDGIDDYINIPAPYSINDVSVSAWFKLNSLPSGGSHYVFNNYDAPSNEWGVAITSSLNIRISADIAGDGMNLYDTPVVIGKWYHVVAIQDQLENIFYIDGVLVGSGTSSTDDWTNLTTGDFFIGAKRGNWQFIDGNIDDVRLYDRALTTSEIQQLYQYGTSQGLGDVDNGCTSPVATEGEMFYNVDFNVMQYCNGEEWVGIGQ